MWSNKVQTSSLGFCDQNEIQTSSLGFCGQNKVQTSSLGFCGQNKIQTSSLGFCDQNEVQTSSLGFYGQNEVQTSSLGFCDQNKVQTGYSDLLENWNFSHYSKSRYDTLQYTNNKGAIRLWMGRLNCAFVNYSITHKPKILNLYFKPYMLLCVIFGNRDTIC